MFTQATLLPTAIFFGGRNVAINSHTGVNMCGVCYQYHSNPCQDQLMVERARQWQNSFSMVVLLSLYSACTILWRCHYLRMVVCVTLSPNLLVAQAGWQAVIIKAELNSLLTGVAAAVTAFGTISYRNERDQLLSIHRWNILQEGFGYLHLGSSKIFFHVHNVYTSTNT